MTQLLNINNLNINLQQQGQTKPLVKAVNFSLSKGETLSLVGESGSGKTMTAMAILKLLPPNIHIDPNSQIHFENQDLRQQPEMTMRKIRAQKIAVVFQDALSALNPVLTIDYQIREVLRQHTKLNRNGQTQRIQNLLEEVGIPDIKRCAQSYPHELSGGMKQRVMIAIALAAEPVLLIADEPTTALDVTIQAQVLKTLKTIQRNHNMAMLFISHDLGVVSNIADRIAVMQQGEIVEQNNTAEIFSNPQHPYTKKLLATIPDIEHLSFPNASTEKKPLLTVNDLAIHFPIKKGLLKRTVDYTRAVDGVNFTLLPGQTLALIGESGSGKTTIGKSILQLLKKTSGDIDLDGITQFRKQVQVIFQDPYAAMNPRMTILQILEEGMRAQRVGKNRATRLARIDQLLDDVGLPIEAKTRYPHEFSGGQRQRICIARALSLEPQLIICDEPTSALDVCVQQQILSLLKDLQQSRNIAYLLITHDFGVVAALAHNVAVMHHGKIVEQGPTNQILHNPQHPYTQKLLSAVPKTQRIESIITN